MNFGWEPIVSLDDHPDFFQFLRQTHLLYAIRGYQKTFQQSGLSGPMETGIRSINGEPHLLKEGQWISWETIRNELTYDPKSKYILDQQGRQWNYFYPNGLVPQSTINHVEPIYTLTPEEMGRLDANPCVVQIFTTDKRVSHAGLRLINQLGQVYSFSFETLASEVTMKDTSCFDFLATVNAHITSPDYAEFDKFKERRVTSLPITEEQFTKALEKVRHYANSPLRFHFIHQNCGTFVADIMRHIGQPIPINCWVRGFAWEMAKDVPFLGPIVLAIDAVVRAIFYILDKITPNFIQVPILFTITILTYIPMKICTIFRNCLMVILGGTKCNAPPKPGAENKWDNSERLTSFDRHIHHWTDIFRDDLGKIYTTSEIMYWQLKSKHTTIHKYDGSPSLTIVPPRK